MNKKVTALLIGAIVAVAGFALWIPSVNASTLGCDSVAIIRCGVSSESDLRTKYDANQNSVQTVYKAFGISRADLSGLVSGTVYKDGRVVVGGKTVATGARTAGHNWGSGDSKRTKISGTDVYIYSTNQLVSDARPVMVKMVDGQFKFAVMNDCGNPVSATPVPVEKPQAVPVYSCDKIAKIQNSRTEYAFTTTATAKDGAKITGYTYNFGDGLTRHFGTDGAQVWRDYTAPGTYTVTVMVEFDVNGQVKTAASPACTTKVTVVPENTMQVCDLTSNTITTIKESDFDSTKHTKDLTKCYIKVCQISTKTITKIAPTDVTSDYTTDLSKCDTPVTPTTPTTPSTPTPAPAETVVLPHTGITDVFSGSLGLGTLTGAGYYYAASRRALRNK